MNWIRFFAVFYLSLCITLHAQELEPDLTIMIPMRDGKELSTDIYLPHPDAKNLPCILLRSPAGRKAAHWRPFAQMAKAGFVIAIQDTRSVLDKEGKTFPFISDGWGNAKDGFDTVEWLAKSPYTNGNIGTWGSSALGITQLLMAPSNPPHLKCQYIIFAASSLYHDAIFPGGQLLKNQTENWLGLYAPDSGVYSYVSQRPFYNEFWMQLDTVSFCHHVNVPGIHIGGWFDTFLQGTLEAFNSRQNFGGDGAKGRQKLVIGPWSHYWPVSTTLGDFPVPKEGYAPPYDISPKRWFDHYLKGENNGAEDLPNVMYYVMGPFDGSPSSGNVWRTSETWPVPSVKASLFLTPDDQLKQQLPFEGITNFIHDPANVTPTIGGNNLFLESGPKDQSEIENRQDVLVFTTDPLKEDVEVTGNISAKIFFTTDQKDTDIVLRLCDVYPDGRSILISEGIYRLGVMHYQKNPRDIINFDRFSTIKVQKDNPLEVNIELLPTSIVFAKGHSIRLSIAGSNYPRYEKNLSVGLIGSHTGLYHLAKNSIYMGPEHPSRIILPIVRIGDKWMKKQSEQKAPSKQEAVHASL